MPTPTANLGISPIDNRRFPVVEIFGPTVQGEGALAGTVSHFVRFGGCDYECAWCDSAPAVLPGLVRSAPRSDAGEILSQLQNLPWAPWVTLSGGNPALHDLDFLVSRLRPDLDAKIAVETQGSRWKPWLANVDLITCSPKPPSSGMSDRTEPGLGDFLGKALATHARLVLKVPVFDRADFEWAAKLHQYYNWPDFYLSVVTRMGGLRGDFADGAIDSMDDILDRYHQVIDWTLADRGMADVRVFPQLHALVWGHERGH